MLKQSQNSHDQDPFPNLGTEFMHSFKMPEWNKHPNAALCCSPASKTDDLSTCVGKVTFVKSSATCLHEERTCYGLLPVDTYRSHTSVHVLMSQGRKPLLLNMGMTVIFIRACFFLSFCLTCVPYIHLCVCAHAMHTTCACVCPALVVTGITFYLIRWQ